MAEQKKNWFAVYRPYLNSPLWLAEKFTKGQAWLDLIGMAAYEPDHFFARGVRVEVARGQLGMSELTMCKRWQWSRGKVRRFLRELESKTEQKIVQQKSNVTTLITILNYDKYQFDGTANGTPSSTASGTPNGTHSINKQVNKEKKKYKIDFNFDLSRWENITQSDLDIWQKAYPAVDLAKQLAQAAAWLDANPSKKKSDYKRFLNGWFKRAQDRGGDLPSNRPHPQIMPKTYAQAQDAERRQRARRLLEMDDADNSEGQDGVGQAGDCLPAIEQKR